jgi:putative transposase
MSKYSVGAHTTHRLKYHLVWIPKYRKRVLRGPLTRRLYELLKQCAEMNQWTVEELNVQHDHVHLLIQLPPKQAVAHAMQLMKGGTSRVIRQESYQ